MIGTIHDFHIFNHNLCNTLYFEYTNFIGLPFSRIYLDVPPGALQCPGTSHTCHRGLFWKYTTVPCLKSALQWCLNSFVWSIRHRNDKKPVENWPNKTENTGFLVLGAGVGLSNELILHWYDDPSSNNYYHVILIMKNCPLIAPTAYCSPLKCVCRIQPISWISELLTVCRREKL